MTVTTLRAAALLALLLAARARPPADPAAKAGARATSLPAQDPDRRLPAAPRPAGTLAASPPALPAPAW